MKLTRGMIQKWEHNKAQVKKRHQAKLREMLEKELRYRMKKGCIEFYINSSLIVEDEDIEYVKSCLRSWGFKASGGNIFYDSSILVRVPSLEEFDGRKE